MSNCSLDGYNEKMKNYFAQNVNIGGQEISGPIDKFESVADIINAAIGIIFPLALFILFVYLLWSGFDMVRNLGNQKLIESAKLRITNAIIGIILLAISYWLAEIAIQAFF